MRILPASEDRYTEITDVWEASVRATHDFLSEEDILFFRPLIASQFLPAVEVHLLVDDRGAIHGFLGVAGKNIEMLFLSPRSRGKGFGGMLLRHAVDALGADAVDVNEQNPDALGFYEHMGFSVVGRSALDAMGKPYPILHMRLAGASDRPRLETRA